MAHVPNLSLRTVMVNPAGCERKKAPRKRGLFKGRLVQLRNSYRTPPIELPVISLTAQPPAIAEA
jgi:hypothetical protein